jgi:hypothetical protein
MAPAPDVPSSFCMLEINYPQRPTAKSMFCCLPHVISLPLARCSVPEPKIQNHHVVIQTGKETLDVSKKAACITTRALKLHILNVHRQKTHDSVPAQLSLSKEDSAAHYPRLLRSSSLACSIN